ncbi:MAG TPA: Kdo hydroxylase family protein [Caulobacteraceae bacterium]
MDDQANLAIGDDAARRLEADGLLHMADRPFRLTPEESELLTAAHADPRAKNVSLSASGEQLRGAACEGPAAERLAALMRRYADWAEALVAEVAPRYLQTLERGRTSFRSRDADEAPSSPRKDDRRMHVDAFASQPTRGRRILRVFSNINPDGEPRVWNVGEPFEAYARRWAAVVRSPFPGEAWALARLGITRSRRSAYDFLMLGLHDNAKLDARYQTTAPRREIAFAAGTSWIVFTDQVVHAALAGRYALEQTFYLPVAAMGDQALSPLRILERLTGRTLA